MISASNAYEERFWAHVLKADDCWIWMAYRDKRGYGISGTGHPTISTRKAHRASYMLAFGNIPSAVQVDHRCLNKSCVKPSHLRLATNKQNSENKPVISSSASGYRGVTFRKERNKWRGAATHNGKTHYAGHFDTAEEAHEAVMNLRNSLFTHNDQDREGETT